MLYIMIFKGGDKNMKNKRKIAAFMLAFAAIALSACGNGGNGTVTETTPETVTASEETTVTEAEETTAESADINYLAENNYIVWNGSEYVHSCIAYDKESGTSEFTVKDEVMPWDIRE